MVSRRQVTAGRGYLSQSELPLTFGLGTIDKVDRVLIRWPGPGPKSGKTELKDLAIDRVHAIVQD